MADPLRRQPATLMGKSGAKSATPKRLRDSLLGMLPSLRPKAAVDQSGLLLAERRYEQRRERGAPCAKRGFFLLPDESRGTNWARMALLLMRSRKNLPAFGMMYVHIDRVSVDQGRQDEV